MRGPEGIHATARVATLLKLAWPIIVSRSTQVVVGFADALMVAHLGESALAATTTGAVNAFSVFILPFGTVFIVSSFSSQFFGKGDLTSARRYAVYGLAVAALAQVMCLAMLPALPSYVRLFAFAPDVEPLLIGYLGIRLVSGGAAVGIEALANYYGGLGNTRLPMIVNVGAMALNVFGNWLLIDGHLGLPALGVEGAAWASTIATTIAFALFLGYFLVVRGAAGRVAKQLRLAELWRMLRFGLPSGFNWFFEFFAFLFFVNVVVAGLGTTALAAMMAVMQLNSVAFMPALAVASAGAIIVGQLIGAGHPDQVPRATLMTFGVAGAWMLLMAAVYLFLPELAFSPFVRGDSSQELMETGARMLMLSALWQVFDAAAMTLAEALRAAGDTVYTLWARTVIAWAVFVPGSWISVRVYGAGEVVAILWLMVYLALLAIVLLLRFRSGAWRRFNLVETPTSESPSR